MSAEATGYVYRYSPHRGSTLLVHLALADTVSDVYDYACWFAVANLATKARVSEKSARRALHELVESGDLTVADPACDPDGKPTGRPVRYRFEFPDRESVYSPRGLVTTTSPISSGGWSPRPGGLVTTTRGVGHHDLRNPIEPKSEPKKNLRARDLDDSGFVAVWKIYPRKLAKQGALKAWRARVREGVDPETLERAVAEYARRCARDRTEPRFVMHAATFFGPNERWRDYVDAETAEPDVIHTRPEVAEIQALNAKQAEWDRRYSRAQARGDTAEMDAVVAEQRAAGLG